MNNASSIKMNGDKLFKLRTIWLFMNQCRLI